MPRTIKPTYIQNKPRVKAVVMFSGGLDSLVALLWAKEKYKQVLALSFDYEQAHRVELEAAAKLVDILKVPHKVVRVQALGELSGGALITGNDKAKMFEKDKSMHRSLFIPCRNPVLVSLAAGVAMTHGANIVVNGEGQEDATLFPDARKEFFQSMQKALALGLGSKMTIATPLMGKTKGQGLKLGAKLYKDFLDLTAISVSCYRGGACGKCPACLLRAQGFEEWGVEDPRVVDAKRRQAVT